MKFKPGDTIRHRDGDVGVVVSHTEFNKLKGYDTMNDPVMVCAVWKTDGVIKAHRDSCTLIKSFKQRNLPEWF